MVAKRRVADAIQGENQNVSKLVTPEMMKVHVTYYNRVLSSFFYTFHYVLHFFIF